MINAERIYLVSSVTNSHNKFSLLSFILMILVFIIMVALINQIRNTVKEKDNENEDSKLDTSFNENKIEYKSIKEIVKEEKNKKIDEDYEQTKKDLGID